MFKLVIAASVSLAGGVDALNAMAQSTVSSPARIQVRADGWDELNFDPRTWRCTRCDPPIMVTLQQSSVAWQERDPIDMRQADSHVFARLLLADTTHRAAFLDNLQQRLRQRFPEHDVRATVVGARRIGTLTFIEADVTLRRNADLTSMASYTTIHKGRMIQFAAMYVVFGPRPLAIREIERFLGGVSIEE